MARTCQISVELSAWGTKRLRYDFEDGTVEFTPWKWDSPQPRHEPIPWIDARGERRLPRR